MLNIGIVSTIGYRVNTAYTFTRTVQRLAQEAGISGQRKSSISFFPEHQSGSPSSPIAQRLRRSISLHGDEGSCESPLDTVWQKPEKCEGRLHVLATGGPI